MFMWSLGALVLVGEASIREFDLGALGSGRSPKFLRPKYCFAPATRPSHGAA